MLSGLGPTPTLEHVQLVAVEVVWNSYVLQLCIINSLPRDYYGVHAPLCSALRRQTLRFFCIADL